jgi:hypothetical protein
MRVGYVILGILRRCGMSTGLDQWAADLAEKIVQAYSIETIPPITSQLKDELRQHLAKELTKAVSARISNSDWGSHINPLIDDWERHTGIVGPRLKAIDEMAGLVTMVARSQADHPLRPFGGQ